MPRIKIAASNLYYLRQTSHNESLGGKNTVQGNKMNGRVSLNRSAPQKEHDSECEWNFIGFYCLYDVRTRRPDRQNQQLSLERKPVLAIHSADNDGFECSDKLKSLQQIRPPRGPGGVWKSPTVLAQRILFRGGSNLAKISSLHSRSSARLINAW